MSTLSIRIIPLLALISLIVLPACGKKALLPSNVTILKPEGITARQSWQKDADRTGAVLPGKTYKVLDGLPGSVRIRLADGSEGWISAGQDGAWVKLLPGKKIRVLRDGGISAREHPFDTGSPIVAPVSSGREYPVLEVMYTHYLVALPEGGKGWIFAGRMDDLWVKAK